MCFLGPVGRSEIEGWTDARRSKPLALRLQSSVRASETISALPDFCPRKTLTVSRAAIFRL
jgi:hypothetical protein